MALFGTGSPKIITSGSVEIALNYAVVLRDEPEWDNIIHEDPLGGKRLSIRTKYRWIYECQIYLYKFADPGATYAALNTALYDDVQLFRHNDAEPICDADGNSVNFWFKELTPIWITTTDYKDALILKFESLGWVDLSTSRFGYLTTDEGDHVLTDDGDHITLP